MLRFPGPPTSLELKIISSAPHTQMAPPEAATFTGRNGADIVL